jgi:hypothetical protein
LVGYRRAPHFLPATPGAPPGERAIRGMIRFGNGHFLGHHGYPQGTDLPLFTQCTQIHQSLEAENPSCHPRAERQVGRHGTKDTQRQRQERHWHQWSARHVSSRWQAAASQDGIKEQHKGAERECPRPGPTLAVSDPARCWQSGNVGFSPLVSDCRDGI